MAGFFPNQAQKISLTAQATAAGSYGTAYFQPGRAYCQVYVYNGSSTKIDYMAQGSNSTSAYWFNLFAAPTSVGSTAGALTRST